MHDGRRRLKGRAQRLHTQRAKSAVYAATVPLAVEARQAPGEPVPFDRAHRGRRLRALSHGHRLGAVLGHQLVPDARTGARRVGRPARRSRHRALLRRRPACPARCATTPRRAAPRAPRLRGLEGSPRVQIEHPDAFFAEAREERPDAPVWVGEPYLELHRAAHTSQARTKRNRRSEHRLREAESWATRAALNAPRYAYPYERLDGLWKTVPLHRFHDAGLLQCLGAPRGGGRIRPCDGCVAGADGRGGGRVGRRAQRGRAVRRRAVKIGLGQ